MSNYIEKANVNYGEVDFEGSRIRTVEEDGQLHFCLSDCLKAVGTTTRTNQIKWDDEMAITKLYPSQDALGRQQVTKFITEAGVYELLEKVNLSNTDPEKSAKVLRFRHKLNYEILPSIRKHGHYVDIERMAGGNLALAERLANAPRSELFRLLAEAEEEKERQTLLLQEKDGKINAQAETLVNLRGDLKTLQGKVGAKTSQVNELVERNDRLVLRDLNNASLIQTLQNTIEEQKAIIEDSKPKGEPPEGATLVHSHWRKKPQKKNNKAVSTPCQQPPATTPPPCPPTVVPNPESQVVVKRNDDDMPF